MEGSTASTASASSGASTQASTTSQSSSAQGQSSSTQGSQSQSANSWAGNPNQSAQDQGASQKGESQSQDQTTQQPRRLGDTDMDAIVTVKINGKTEELPLKEVIKLQQLEKASHEKMRQAAETQRKAQELMNLDIRELAKLRGQDFRELAEQELAEAYELMNMSPEQRRLHELEQREAQRAEQLNMSRKQVIDEIKNFVSELPPGADQATPEQLHGYLDHVKQVYQMTEQNLEREFVEAWKETGLPKTPFIGARMAFMLKNGKNDDGTPLQTKDAAVKVQKAYVSDVREFFTKMDAKAIQETLGNDILQKLRDFDVQRVTSHQASSTQQKSPGQQPASEPKRYLNQSDWRKAMGLS